MSSRQREGRAPAGSTGLVNGVFQGGGAKVIANVGALQAVEERGLWFGSVAGASAGAITAALIASGMTTSELEAALPEGLATIHTSVAARLGLAVLGRATAVYDTEGLRRWIDERLSQQINASGDGPITFRQLHEASGIELYVLAVDLATQLPVVFSRRSTPDVEVAGAVIASSAIPGALPSGRAVFSSGDGARVHQLTDGGGWANYPSFIFQDRGFRTWLRGECELAGAGSSDEEAAWIDEAARPVMGFVFGEAEPAEHRNSVGFLPLDAPTVDRRFDLGPTYTSRKRATYLLGATLSSDWARLMIGLALVVWATMAVATLPVAFRRYSTWLAEWAPDALFPLLLVASLAIAVLAIVIAIATIALLLLVSRLLADTLLPAFSAVFGVPMDVPPWTGLGDDSVVIRVPDDGLRTLNFAVDPAEREKATAVSKEGVAAQLDDDEFRQRLDALFTGDDPPVVPYRRGARLAPPPGLPSTSPVAMFLVLVASAAAIGGLAWWATKSAGSAGILQIMIAVIVAVIGVGAAFLYIGKRAGSRAHVRASTDVTAASLRPRIPPAVLWMTGAVLLVAGGTLSFLAMDDRADSTLAARVVVAEDTGTDFNRYVMQVDGVDNSIEVSTERHLRLGEQVFVDVDDESDVYSLAGPLDDGRFGISVALWVLGFGALTSAERSRRWVQRCRRLDEVVTTWKQE
jgi:predicted acylesterase/phospholipase RssA